MHTVQEAITGREDLGDVSSPYQALRQFYCAFNARDMEMMSQNWAQADDVVMDNPLGGIKRGWSEIAQVYRLIFAGPASVYVEYFDYTLHETTDMFYTVGRERGYLRTGGEEIALAIRTTRVFRRIDGRWNQVHHHGSIEEPRLLARYQAAVLGRNLPLPAMSGQEISRPASPVQFKTVSVNGVNLFYRDAGPRDAPVILLLHGFPSSSRMFATLMPRLADRYRVIVPDYPGFGHSDAPPPERFSYTFDHLADCVGGLIEQLAITRYALYLQDYGGPVGFRLALAHPERVAALIIQNAVVHLEGLSPAWDIRKAFWRERPAHEETLRQALLSPDVARGRHAGHVAERIDPDTWGDELAFLMRPGMDRIQLELMFDYRTNVAAYPAWQAYLREHRPPTLVVWGKLDTLFTLDGALAFGREVPDAEIHLLNAGHFALDEEVDTVAALMRRFLARIGLKLVGSHS
jgi:pimeloyl-ACP methyl ester carboxylesterase/ketosteroid isomerase-like protein